MWDTEAYVWSEVTDERGWDDSRERGEGVGGACQRSSEARRHVQETEHVASSEGQVRHGLTKRQQQHRHELMLAAQCRYTQHADCSTQRTCQQCRDLVSYQFNAALPPSQSANWPNM